MNFNPNMLLNTMLQRNPNMAQNPVMGNYINTIRNNDAQRGEQIADNICASMGLTREQAIAQAKKFFNIR